MTDRAPLRVVILGAGLIGGVHRRAAQLAGAELVGVMAHDEEATQAAAQAWGTASVGGLAQLADISPDVVHVCTPNAFHVEHATAAFAAGAHVICEKPLATDSAEADRLVELAAGSGRVATVPYVYRFHPLVREIRARAQAGEFGRWQLLHGSYLQDWLLDPLATSWRVSSATGGPSRTFADIGSHWCDLMEFVTGERIAAVMAATTITVPQRPAGSTTTFGGAGSRDGNPAMLEVDTEDAATVMFRTESGVLGTVAVSQVSAGRRNRLWFEFDGATKSAVFDQEKPETVWLGSPASDEVLHRDPSHGAQDARRLSTLPAGHPQGYAQCFESFVADTYAAVRGDKPEGLPTFADGARSIRLIDAVLASAESGRWTDVHEAVNA